MSDISSALSLMYKEHADQARQHESQRERATAAVLGIATAIIGVVNQDSFALRTLPIAVLLIPLGIFGWMFASKHYERNRFHSTAAGLFRNALDAELAAPAKTAPAALLGNIRTQAQNAHAAKYLLDKQKSGNPGVVGWRLYRFWNNLHISISAIGVVLTLTIIAIHCPRLCSYVHKVF